MAKDISLLGANYPGVPAVELPQTGGGTATFYDIQVVDNLTSTSTTDALSANQGRVLNNKISDTHNYKYTLIENIQLVANDAAVYNFTLGDIKAVSFHYSSDLYYALITDGASLILSAEDNRIIIIQKGTSTRPVKVKVMYEE